MSGLSVQDKCGELRNQFYLQLSQHAGERLADYASRFRTSVADLKAEGVVLPDGEIGWWFKENLGLDDLRRQLRDTALQGNETYAVIEPPAQDSLFRKALTIRKPFSSAGSCSSMHGAFQFFAAYQQLRAELSSKSSAGLPGPRRPPPPQQVHETAR